MDRFLRSHKKLPPKRSLFKKIIDKKLEKAVNQTDEQNNDQKIAQKHNHLIDIETKRQKKDHETAQIFNNLNDSEFVLNTPNSHLSPIQTAKNIHIAEIKKTHKSNTNPYYTAKKERQIQNESKITHDFLKRQYGSDHGNISNTQSIHKKQISDLNKNLKQNSENITEDNSHRKSTLDPYCYKKGNTDCYDRNISRYSTQLNNSEHPVDKGYLHHLHSTLYTIYCYNSLKNRKTYLSKSIKIIETTTKRKFDPKCLNLLKNVMITDDELVIRKKCEIFGENEKREWQIKRIREEKQNKPRDVQSKKDPTHPDQNLIQDEDENPKKEIENIHSQVSSGKTHPHSIEEKNNTEVNSENEQENSHFKNNAKNKQENSHIKHNSENLTINSHVDLRSTEHVSYDISQPSTHKEEQIIISSSDNAKRISEKSAISRREMDNSRNRTALSDRCIISDERLTSSQKYDILLSRIKKKELERKSQFITQNANNPVTHNLDVYFKLHDRTIMKFDTVKKELGLVYLQENEKYKIVEIDGIKWVKKRD